MRKIEVITLTVALVCWVALNASMCKDYEQDRIDHLVKDSIRYHDMILKHNSKVIINNGDSTFYIKK